MRAPRFVPIVVTFAVLVALAGTAAAQPCPKGKLRFIGAIGFEGRWDYGAIGTVTNLASRLCGEATAGHVLVSSRVASAVEELVDVEEVGALTLKGLARPVPTLSVRALRG